MTWVPQAVDPDGRRFVVVDGDRVGVADVVAGTVAALPPEVDRYAPLGHGTWEAPTAADLRRFEAAGLA